MADNVTLNPGAGGATLASDNIAGVQYPRSKLVYGADGANDGDVARDNPFPARDYLLSPQTSTSSAATVAAGGQGTIDSAQISADKTGQLLKVVVAASVAVKATLYTVAEGVVSAAIMTEFGWSGRCELRAPSREFVTAAWGSGGGFDGFRVVVTNLDPTLAADIHAVFFWDEVDS